MVAYNPENPRVEFMAVGDGDEQLQKHIASLFVKKCNGDHALVIPCLDPQCWHSDPDIL